MATQITTIHGIKPYAAKKKEDYMSDGQVEHFRSILSAWRAELMDETQQTVHQMQDESSTFADPADRASQETDMAIELRNRDRDRKLVKRIDKTILTLEDEYGFCHSCGEEIGIMRLEARPTATQCVDCKTLDEIREKQMA
ncbi:MAG: RNA polymerase-binding protein DksA [Arenicellales bacterium]